MNVEFMSKLESTYHEMRIIQTQHDETAYRCNQAGNCCKVGLKVSLMECLNVANYIKRQIYVRAERDGFDKAQDWYDKKINSLIDAMYNEKWTHDNQETGDYCAFSTKEEGCGIYEARFLVCRSYGTITPVTSSCPRKRLPDGQTMIFRDEHVDQIIDDFDDELNDFNIKNPELAYSVYMPMGVLKFLLSEQEMRQLYKTTDPKFWQGTPGYSHRLRMKDWDVEVKELVQL